MQQHTYIKIYIHAHTHTHFKLHDYFKTKIAHMLDLPNKQRALHGALLM